MQGYDEMTNLPLTLRTALAADVPFSTLAAETEQTATDGTVKTLFRTHDGHPVEAVLMRYRDGRRSVCVSSQSGCPLTCTFCATGSMAFGRNLTASEILDQVLHFRRLEPVNHLVFMGMGEPLMNVEAVLEAARRLPDVGITHRRTTISTVGWLPGLTRFVEDVDEPIRLALSIHAADPALRSELMPVNDRYPLPDVRRALPGSLGADEPSGLRRVRDARRRERLARAGQAARGAPRPGRVQGEPHPVQPDGSLRRIVPRGDRGIQGGARSGPDPGDRPAHARAGHRGGVRAARHGAAPASERRLGSLLELRHGVADPDRARLDDARVDPAEVERAPFG